MEHPPAENYWPHDICARAYWSQHELPTYQDLLADTRAWLVPQPSERWLDLGCGGGQLTRALWLDSGGSVAEILGMDCAAVNELAFQGLRQQLRPRPTEQHIRFITADFATGLSSLPANHFDGVVSGLAIQYAEFFSPEVGQWTTDAYNAALSETFRILRPGGRFIFSVNVPNPNWARIGWQSFTAIFTSKNPLRFLKNGLRMWRFGNWVKREAARGRFHYLPVETVIDKLQSVGFMDVEYRLTYAGQAFLLRCWKPKG
jgi:ubiquinone/menaquinone biosynthesis C-methylase UbiE